MENVSMGSWKFQFQNHVLTNTEIHEPNYVCLHRVQATSVIPENVHAQAMFDIRTHGQLLGHNRPG
jgi:hypothetical protein